MPKRFDISSLDFMMEDNNGFFKGDGIVTRTGVFTYANSDGTLRRELRHPDDVLRIDSLKTMEMIPLTNNHPTDLVTPMNAKELSVGFVGENIRPDGSHVAASVAITDGNTIEEIKAGKQQLSLGYSVDLIDEVGEYDGIKYDARQTNIRYNHLALVNSARAGNKAKLKFDAFNLDADDAIMIVDKKDDNSSNNNKQKPKQEINRMSKFTIDSLSYDAAPEVVNYLNKLQNKHDTIEKELTIKLDELDDMTKDLTKVTAERDASLAKFDKLEKKDNSDEINATVKERIDILTIANKVLDGKKHKIDEMTNSELMEQVVINQDSTFKLDSIQEDQRSVYLKARYDFTITSLDKKIVNQQKKIVTNIDINKDINKDTDVIDADDAREKMIKDSKEMKVC